MCWSSVTENNSQGGVVPRQNQRPRVRDKGEVSYRRPSEDLHQIDDTQGTIRTNDCLPGCADTMATSGHRTDVSASNSVTAAAAAAAAAVAATAAAAAAAEVVDDRHPLPFLLDSDCYDIGNSNKIFTSALNF